jgi:predicted nuclease of predicted toxin-antitoxin system
VSTPKLRLLLDESVTDPLADGILRLCQSAVYVRRNPLLKGKKDPQIAEEANRTRRTIVAIDSDYNEISVSEGVIKLNANRTSEECLVKMFNAFWKSGHRAEAKTRRTYLTDEGIRMTNGAEKKYPWKKHPCGPRER